jgi:deoxycytidine triphosphate deaminase
LSAAGASAPRRGSIAGTLEALTTTIAYFRVPLDELVICLGKLTYARCGIIVNVTLLEPEWEDHVTKGKYMRQHGVALPKL